MSYFNDEMSQNQNNMENEKGLWGQLGKVNKLLSPITSMLYENIKSSILLLIVLVSLVEIFLSMGRSPYGYIDIMNNAMTSSFSSAYMSFFSFGILSIISTSIRATVFLAINRVAYKLVADRKGNKFKSELSINILISMLFADILTYSGEYHIISALAVSALSVLLLLALDWNNLRPDNYKKIGILYLLCRIVILLIAYGIALLLMLLLLGLAGI